MCIIVHKPSGVSMPSQDILSNCFESNADGAGIAYKLGNSLIYRKGFMTFPDLSQELQALSDDIDLKDTEMTLHFRIGTSGGVNAAKCHPFPVVKSFADMEKAEGQADNLFFHNGIVGKGSKEHSDTEFFTRDILRPIVEKGESPKSLLDAYSNNGNKFVLMSKNAPSIISGKFIKQDGVLYSNDSYSFDWSRYSSKYSFNYDLKDDELSLYYQDNEILWELYEQAEDMIAIVESSNCVNGDLYNKIYDVYNELFLECQSRGLM